MQEGKIQWHPAFIAALKVELMDDAEYLKYSEERPLSHKPLQVDILLEKEISDAQVKKTIGHIFRRYNVFEYKSPNDYLSVNDFYKTYAYACLFQADTESVLEIDPEEITISFVCYHYPKELFKHLAQVRGITIQRYDIGIYYLLASPYLFPMQVILLSDLPKDNYYWMQCLRNNLKSGGEIKELMEKYEDKKGSNLYQAIMDVIVRANQKEMEVEKKMCEALKELFADEFQKCREEAQRQGLQSGLEQGMQQGIQQGIQQGMQQGMQRGMRQGELNTMHNSIMDFLTDFGTVSSDIQAKVYSTNDMLLLKKWLKMAARADSLEDFRMQIG